MKKQLNDLELTRYRNTRYLIENSCGTKAPQKEFSDRVGLEPSYVSGIASKNMNSITRAIGEKIAREIEAAFNKEPYWLDRPRHKIMVEDQPQPSSAREAVQKYVAKSEKSLPILSLEQAELMRSGLLNIDNQTINAYRQPFGINPSSKAFAFRETTTLMPPFKPGDVYLVDPEKRASPEDAVLCNLAGTGLVGILKRGVRGYKLEFYDKTESPIQIDPEQIIGTVIHMALFPHD